MIVDLILGIARVLGELVFNAAWWVSGNRVRRDRLAPGVSPATYGRKQRKVTGWFERLGRAYFWGYVVLILLFLAAGIMFAP